MPDIQLETTDIHDDVLAVEAPPKDPKKRASLVSTLRGAANREEGMTVHLRDEDVFVATSDAGRQAIPKIAGRGRAGLSLGDLVETARGA